MSKYLNKCISIVNSCKTHEQLDTCMNLLKNSTKYLNDDEVLYLYRIMRIKNITLYCSDSISIKSKFIQDKIQYEFETGWNMPYILKNCNEVI